MTNRNQRHNSEKNFLHTRDYTSRRRKQRGFGRTMVLILFVVCVIAAAFWQKSVDDGEDTFSMEYVMADEVALNMQFTYYSAEEWQEKLGSNASGRLTYQNVEDLLELLQINEYVSYEKKRSGKALLRRDWDEIYKQILDLLDTSQKVRTETIVLLEQTVDEQGSQIVSQLETILDYPAAKELESYQTYEVYCMEDEIIGIAGLSADTVVVSNTYITGMAENLDFLYQNKSYSIPIESDEKIENTVCDISFSQGSVTKLQKKEDIIEGKLIALSEEKIEIEGYGVIDRANRLPVYQSYGTAAERTLSDIVLGNMKLVYVVANKCVSAILLTEPAEIATVRVLLLSDAQTPYRASAAVSSTSTFTVSCAGSEEELAGGTVVNVADYLADKPDASMLVHTDTEDGIYLCDETGTKLTNAYGGTIEVRSYDEGYAVVNAIPMEEYLYGVVSSEMSSSFPIEALKAQAVCARSYAYIQLLKSDYAYLGAHIDDSTNYQVYNKQESGDSIREAVDATTGLVLTYQGEVAEAYYYSTSYGHSGEYSSWSQTDNPAYGYLSGGWLKAEAEEMDLSDETVFAAYITKPDDSCFDSFARFFRWKCELDLTKKTAAVREKINQRKKVRPDDIEIIKTANDISQENVNRLGKVVSFSVEERNSSGGVINLKVNFKKGTVNIHDEYSIRLVLGVLIERVSWQDGSSSAELSVLPSSYFTITSEADGTYEVTGGGYGHGLGMSQNGAKGMAEAGIGYEEILRTFYRDIELEDCYSIQQ